MRLKWLWIFLTGAAVFAAVSALESATGDRSLFPAIIILGALTVPAAFVAYFYEHIRDRDISVATLIFAFVIGGALGLLAAFFVETRTITHQTFGTFVAGGFH